MLSEEQQAVVDAARSHKNVAVQACPGAGKTHTLREVEDALRRRGSSVLCLTYSSALKAEWRAKSRFRSERQHVHSFHSWAALLYGEQCACDDDMERLLRQPLPEGVPESDAILIDETQDMNENHLRLLRRYVEATSRVQLVVVGDVRQCVYDYVLNCRRRADTRFLASPERALADVCAPQNEWTFLRMSESRRLTRNMATFVNVFFGLNEEDYIRGVHAGDRPVHYYCENMFRRERQIARNIYERYIDVYGAENVKIITAFRGDKQEDSTFATHICNILSTDYQVPLRRSNEVGTNCTVRYTFPGCKGTEAQCTIVLGANVFNDTSFAQRFVASTRASEQLVLYQHYENEPWGNLDMARRLDESVFQYFENEAPRLKRKMPMAKPVTVTDLCGAIDLSPCLIEALRAIEWRVDTPAASPMTYSDPAMPQGTNATFTPNYSRIYGIAGPLLFDRRRLPSTQTPDMYLRIFQTIVVTASYKEFCDGLLAELRHLGHTQVALRLQSLQAKLASQYSTLLDRKSSHERKKEAMRAVEQHHLPACNPTEDDLLRFLQRFLTVHGLSDVKMRLQSASAYNLAFPVETRNALEERVPLTGEWTARQVVEAACAAQAYSGEHHTMAQMVHYDWADPNVLCEAVRRIEACVGSVCVQTEREFAVQFCAPLTGTRPSPVCSLSGRVDVLDHKTGTVFELKFCQDLDDAAKAQLWLYMHMVAYCTPRSIVHGKLLNTRTGEELSATLHTTPCASGRFLARVVRDIMQTDHLPDLHPPLQHTPLSPEA